jgi:phenylacetate-coenzyme A ligase PaaK-like adenylate-forming protein
MREAELLAHDRWSREELLEFQRERLRALIAHVVSYSSYYREVLGADAADRPLAELPTLPKATLMAEFDRIVTDPRLRLDDLRTHLAGPDPSQSFLGAYRVATTSGTTGRQSIVALTHVRRRVRKAWGIEPVSGYAATEAPTIAASSPEHAELEIVEDVVIVEIVDDKGRPVAPGRPGAKVLLTNLINYAQPLIRYELTDSVVESPLPNPAGRPWRCLLSVDGRTADILYLLGTDGATVPVHPSVLGSAVAPIAEVGEYAFVYDSNGLHAQIVLTAEASPGVPERLRAALVTAIGSTGALPPAVDVRQVPALDREPGGKVRLVRSV